MSIRPETTKRYDLSDPNVMYVGEADWGTDNDVVGWTIRRIVLVNGLPTEEMTTGEHAAIWDNRLTETYG